MLQKCSRRFLSVRCMMGAWGVKLKIGWPFLGRDVRPD